MLGCVWCVFCGIWDHPWLVVPYGTWVPHRQVYQKEIQEDVLLGAPVAKVPRGAFWQKAPANENVENIEIQRAPSYQKDISDRCPFGCLDQDQLTIKTCLDALRHRATSPCQPGVILWVLCVFCACCVLCVLRVFCLYVLCVACVLCVLCVVCVLRVVCAMCCVVARCVWCVLRAVCVARVVYCACCVLCVLVYCVLCRLCVLFCLSVVCAVYWMSIF